MIVVKLNKRGKYLNGSINEIKYYFRNGSIKPADFNLSTFIKPTCAPWTADQIKEIKSRCNQVLRFDFQQTINFCDCIVDSVSRHVDFNVIDTLSDIDRNSIYQTVMQNGACNNLLTK